MFPRKRDWVAAALVTYAGFAMAQPARRPAQTPRKVIQHVPVKATNAAW